MREEQLLEKWIEELEILLRKQTIKCLEKLYLRREKNE